MSNYALRLPESLKQAASPHPCPLPEGEGVRPAPRKRQKLSFLH